MCNHPLPKDEEDIEVEVENINSYGKFSDSLGSPKLVFKYKCPNCGSEVRATTYADIRESDTSTEFSKEIFLS